MPEHWEGPVSNLEIVNLGTNWSEGDRRSVYAADIPAPHKAEIKIGTKAAPDTGYGPVMGISRTLNVAESTFAGAGEAGLAGVTVTTLALEASEGQAIGGSFGAVTESSHEGAHSLADAIAVSAVGVSRKGSRTGMGLFVMGRRETAAGRITGMEVVSDNETETPEAYTGTLPGTKGIHLHAFGTANSAIGLILGKPGTAAMDAGIGAVAGSVVTAFIRDDSGAKWGILLKSAHEKAALAISKGAGQLVIGLDEAKSATPLLELYTETTLDPMYSLGTDKGVSVRGNLSHNSVGNVAAFTSAGTNAFMTGTVSGDSGFTFAAGKIFHIGAAAKTSMLRIEEAALGFYGVAPVARAAAIGEPAETLGGLKAAVNSIRTALKNIGITS